MATIRATFVLTDNASSKLNDIHDAAQRAERQLEALDKRMGKMSKDHGTDTDRINRDLKKWDRESDKAHGNVIDRLDKIDDGLKRVSRQRSTIRLKADTSHAERSLGRVEALMNRLNAGSGSFFRQSRAGRSLGGFLDGYEKRSQGIAGIFGGLSKATRGIGINFGMISARLNALLPLIVFLGGPAITAASAGVGALAVGIGALGTVAVGAVGGLAALATGIGALAVPIGIAVSRFKEKRDALEKARENMAKYKEGTRGWVRAQYDMNKAMAAFTPEEREVNNSLNNLMRTWDKFVTNGKSGARAMDMIKSSLQIATGLVPTLANQMDRFTFKGQGLFADAQKNTPAVAKQMQETMFAWPQVFDKLARAGGNFGMGFLKVLEAASPLIMWMADETLKISRNFNEWMDKPENFAKVRKFFLDMREPIRDIAGFLWNFAKTWVSIADNPKVRSAFHEIIESLERGLGWLDKEVPEFSESFEKDLLPAIERTFRFLGNIWEMTAPWINMALDGVTQITEMLNGTSAGKWVGLMALLASFGPTRGLLTGALGALGQAAAPNAGKGGVRGAAGRAGKAVSQVSDMIAPDVHVTNSLGTSQPIPVWVMNPGFGGGVDDLKRGKGRIGRNARGLAGALALAGIAAPIGAAVLGDTPAKLPTPFNPAHTNGPSVNATPLMGPPNPYVNAPKPFNYTYGGAVGAAISTPGWAPPKPKTPKVPYNPNFSDRWNKEAQKRGVDPRSLSAGDVGQSKSWLDKVPLVAGSVAGIATGGAGLMGLLGSMAGRTALGTGAGVLGSAAPAMGASNNKAKKEMSWWERAVSRVNSAVESVTGKAASKAAARASSANRAMVSNANASARSLIGTFSAAVKSVWDMVQGAVSGAGQALSAATGAGSSTPGTGSAGGGSGTPTYASANFNSVDALSQSMGLQITSTTGGKHAPGSWHYSGEAKDYSNGFSPTPEMDQFYNSLVPLAKSGAVGQLIYKHNGWSNGSAYNYKGNDHFNHVHVGIRKGKQDSSRSGDAPPSMSGGGSSVASNITSSGGSGGISISFSGAQFHIASDDDYDVVMEKLAEKLGQALGAHGNASTSEMVGAD